MWVECREKNNNMWNTCTGCAVKGTLTGSLWENVTVTFVEF